MCRNELRQRNHRSSGILKDPPATKQILGMKLFFNWAKPKIQDADLNLQHITRQTPPYTFFYPSTFSLPEFYLSDIMSAPTLPASHTQVRLARRPNSTGNLDTAQVFEVVSSPTPRVEDVKEGELLVHTLYLSMDPSMRVWVNEEERPILMTTLLLFSNSYLPPVELGGVMRGSSICGTSPSHPLVLRLDSHSILPDYTADPFYTALRGCRLTSPGLQERRPDHSLRGDLAGLRDSYAGTEDQDSQILARLKRATSSLCRGPPVLLEASQVRFFNPLSSPSRLIVVNIHSYIKQVKLPRLLAPRWLSASRVALTSASGSRKSADPDFNQKLKDTVPRGVDVYFDNVGGEITDAVYQCMNMHGRVIACGAISQYNNPNPVGLSWLTYQSILLKRLRIEGFIVLDYVSRWAEAVKVMSGWLAQGKIKRTETIVTGGVKEAPKALSMLFSGGNTGKLIMQTEKSRL
ncbi:hypothetical protein BC936DRAFT_148331 [Jimgerdemannia flammicorona]|uniref:Enoyl reductase (ER) domain-containing protein n=1 Tax=Jimgerdemannia flammicorona TaxID=994334 RepID=A0A433D377_9FUNG|nr:hypothetical protein BC936DRAFT_148331 [Jimgerdemannia flammicorona]